MKKPQIFKGWLQKTQRKVEHLWIADFTQLSPRFKGCGGPSICFTMSHGRLPLGSNHLGEKRQKVEL